MEKVAIRLRTCTRCGHEECPCCRDFCDVANEDPGADGSFMCACLDSEEGHCVYDEPKDEEGYARLDAAMDRAGMPCGISSDPPHGVIVTRDDEEEPVDETQALN